jgi:hypothetical protein
VVCRPPARRAVSTRSAAARQWGRPAWPAPCSRCGGNCGATARSGRPLAPGPAGSAGAAAGAGEHQDRRITAGWQLAADGRDDLRGERDLADAGVALGSRFEAAPEPAGLIPGVHDLEDGQWAVQVDAAAAQPGQLPEPQPGAEQAQHVVPPRTAGTERAAARPPRGRLHPAAVCGVAGDRQAL